MEDKLFTPLTPSLFISFIGFQLVSVRQTTVSDVNWSDDITHIPKVDTIKNVFLILNVS